MSRDLGCQSPEFLIGQQGDGYLGDCYALPLILPSLCVKVEWGRERLGWRDMEDQIGVCLLSGYEFHVTSANPQEDW